jgi:Rod binding domain-containing protein
MDSAKLILPNPLLTPVPLEHLSGISLFNKIKKLQTGKTDEVRKEEKEQIAKDFESVLLQKLFDEVKNTIGDWGFEKDAVSEQVQGMFWLYLARHIADNGGFGMWKDIYQFLTTSDQTNTAGDSLDRNI